MDPNQWEVHLIEFRFCEDARPDPQLQEAKAQHSVLIADLNRQGYLKGSHAPRDPRCSNGDYLQAIQTNLWQTLIWITIRLKS